MPQGLILRYGTNKVRHEQVLWTDVPGAPPPIPPFAENKIKTIPIVQFKQQLVPLHLGRFYPARVLNDWQAMPGEMFRVVGLEAERFFADFNHPLAQAEVAVGHEALPDLPAGRTPPVELLRWGGIELPLTAGSVDFADADAIVREDEGADPAFYTTPRKLLHVDGVCAQRIQAFYARHLAPKNAVLDLMAAWRSHLPEGLGQVTGLGMNAEELADNPQLTQRLVHDLNANPVLPFEDAGFDAVVNAVSIEYLIRPVTVLREVRRCLQPGGKVLITFSNRFFPPKTIMLWKRLHPVERVAWVMQCLTAAGFEDIETRIERGLQRDPGDPYVAQFKEMDPLFALSAIKR